MEAKQEERKRELRLKISSDYENAHTDDDLMRIYNYGIESKPDVVDEHLETLLRVVLPGRCVDHLLKVEKDKIHDMEYYKDVLTVFTHGEGRLVADLTCKLVSVYMHNHPDDDTYLVMYALSSTFRGEVKEELCCIL